MLHGTVGLCGSLVAHQPFGAEVPGLGIFHHDPDALLDHFYLENLRVERGTLPTPEQCCGSGRLLSAS